MRILIEGLQETRNLFIALSVILVFLILLIIGMYPGDEQAVKILTTLEDVGIYKLFLDTTYGKGAEYRLWLAFEEFSYIYFIPIVMAIFIGSSIFAAEQDDNRLDILMSMPLSRVRIFFEKYLSMIFLLIAVVTIGFLSTLIPSVLMNYNISFDLLFVSWYLMLPLIIFFGTLASFFGIYFLERFKARIYLLELMAAMFFLTIISRTSASLENLSYLSIFRYYNGPEIILMKNIQDINVIDPILLLTLTIVLLGFIIWWLKGHDLIPHYDFEKPKKEGKVRGIPRLFFYTTFLRNKYPSLVEQITADRMIMNLFLLFMVFLGLSGPLFYPGEEEWAATVSSLGSNIMYDAMLQGRTVPPTLLGYMMTQGYAALFLWFGIFIIVMGPRIVTRDNNSNMTDLLMANPVTKNKVIIERIMAFSLEMITVFVVVSLSSIIGQAGNNDLSGILFTTTSFGVAVILYWALAMVGLVVAVYLNNRPKTAGSVFAGVYMIVLTPYLFSSLSEPLKFLSQLTPFYWYDAYAIILEKTLNLRTLGPIIVFLLIGILAIAISIMKFEKIDIIDTFEQQMKETHM